MFKKPFFLSQTLVSENGDFPLSPLSEKHTFVEFEMNQSQSQPEILQQIFLQADSACHAWYRLRLLHIRDGYVIEKSSGSSRGHGQIEAWFRWGREDAERVFSKIIQKKTRPNRTRVYRMGSSSTQLDLFASEH
jgi:hypothetical protein